MYKIIEECVQCLTGVSFFNPNQPGLFWRLSSPGGGGGGGAAPAPPSDLGRGSRDRRENLHKGRVQCKLQDCIVRLFFIIIFYFNMN